VSRPQFLLLILPAIRLGVHEKLEGDTARPADPSLPKDYPMQHNTVLSNKKLEKEGGREGHLKLWCLSSQLTFMHDEVLLSWKWLNSCLPVQSSELITLLYLCLQLLLSLLNCLFLNAQVFSILPFQFSPLSHCGE